MDVPTPTRGRKSCNVGAIMIDRYDIEVVAECVPLMLRNPSGRYVLHTDYEALQLELAGLQQHAQFLWSEIQFYEQEKEGREDEK